jgi:hypothetical protein
VLPVIHQTLAYSQTKYNHLNFGPRWGYESDGEHKSVEPDIFIRFDKFDMVIEAKRSDVIEQQSRAQWEKEIKGYLNEYGEENRKLHFIALSGLKNLWQHQEPVLIGDCCFDVNVIGWKKLLNSVNAELDKLKRLDNELYNHTTLILSDIINAFEIHGFYTGKMLDSLSRNFKITHTTFKNRISNYFLFKPFPANLRQINLHTNKLKKWQLSPQTN